MNEHEKNELILRQRQEIARLTFELANEKALTAQLKESLEFHERSLAQPAEIKPVDLVPGPKWWKNHQSE